MWGPGVGVSTKCTRPAGHMRAAHMPRPRVFGDGRWRFGPEHDALRTIHYVVAGGRFFAIGESFDAR